MACNQCSVKFNFFHKENGCPNCGLSFCNKCLKNKAKVSGKGETPVNVCKICYNHLCATPGPVSNTKVVVAPETYFKRIENHDKNNQVSSVSSNSSKNTVSPIDQRIYDRLQKLKEKKSSNNVLSETEIRKRLAKLKGENFIEGSSKSISLVSVDSRNDQEKADDLLEQFVNERNIELEHDPQEEIEARLAILRERGVRPNEGPFLNSMHDNGGDSDNEVDKVTKKIMAEVSLEEKTVGPDKKSSVNSSDDDLETDEVNTQSTELPWCVLCNNDAKFRCLDCGGDLYCAECNREVHQTWDDTNHRVILYKSSSK